jgi:hypothetical protein
VRHLPPTGRYEAGEQFFLSGHAGAELLYGQEEYVVGFGQRLPLHQAATHFQEKDSV